MFAFIINVLYRSNSTVHVTESIFLCFQQKKIESLLSSRDDFAIFFFWFFLFFFYVVFFWLLSVWELLLLDSNLKLVILLVALWLLWLLLLLLLLSVNAKSCRFVFWLAFFAPLVLLAHLFLFFRRKVVFDVERFSDIFGRFAFDHTGNSFAYAFFF